MKNVIDVVIPTFRPGERFLEILERLQHQELPVRAIHVINTDRDGMEALLSSRSLTQKALLDRYPGLDVEHITPAEFDHGATRNRGAAKCAGATYVLMLTQDALPADEKLTAHLVRAMQQDDRIEAAYARQLPNGDAAGAERITRGFNYPETAAVHAQEDLPRLGVRTYFCSNVCALYRLDVFRMLGGFPEHMIFNEDMVYAGRALQAGWKVAYAADALVYHSHNYTAGQQFHRNFDLGVSQADHPEIFAAAGSEKEGVRYVKEVIHLLKGQGDGREIPGFVVTCGMRYLGYRLGRHYRKLPSGLIRWCSMNRYYWDRTDRTDS